MRTPGDRRALDRALASRRKRANATLDIARSIVEDVAKRGDVALFAHTRRLDKARITSSNVRLDPATFRERARQLPAELKRALREAAARIRAYHEKQSLQPFSIKTPEGTLSQIVRPLARAGVYVPGGHTVYPSSVLMNVIPAQVAGVREIAVVTPPREGLHPALAYTFSLLGIKEVYQVGGAQAIAALAYGAKSIAAVDKIVGPGRSVVAQAKRLVYGVVDIDMVAGPSEVAILADSSADTRHVALDMLSQAEHGSGDELAVCVTESTRVAETVRSALQEEMADSPVREVFNKLASPALVICVTLSRPKSIALLNELAPEHLQIMTARPKKDLASVNNAGAIFLGPHTPVAMGDYFVGTNHVLPTGGAARFASGLGVDDFQKRISVADVSAAGLRRAAPHVSALARAEAFVHHALSVERR